jgi:hypothetical protein
MSLAAGKEVSLAELAQVLDNARGEYDRITVHWTGGSDGKCYNNYQICVTQDGAIHLMYNDLCFENDCWPSHTWHENIGNLGIGMTCCPNATCSNHTPTSVDLGSEPPTAEQIEMVAEVLALALKYLDLSINDIKTHAEWADIDGYGLGSGDNDTKWDCLYLPDYYGDAGGYTDGGDLLRNKAKFYLYNK